MCGVHTAGVVWRSSRVAALWGGDAGDRLRHDGRHLEAFGCIAEWVTPNPWQLATLVGAGLMSGLAQWLMTEGYRAAETTLVAPFEYGAIIYASVLGIAIWGEWPDVWSLAGIAVLIASGLYIWHREVTLGLRR